MSNPRRMMPGEIELLDEDCWSPADELFAEVFEVNTPRRTSRLDD